MANDPRDILLATRRRQYTNRAVTIPNSGRFAEELAEKVAEAVAQAVASAVTSVLTRVEIPAPVVDVNPAVTIETAAPDLAKPIAAAADILVSSLGPILDQLAIRASQQPIALIDDDSLDRVLKRVGMPARGRGGPLEVWLKRAGTDERITPATEETLAALLALFGEELLMSLPVDAARESKQDIAEATRQQIRDRIGTTPGRTLALSLDSIDDKVAEQATLLALQQSAGTTADANTLNTRSGILKRIRDSLWDGTNSLLSVVMGRLPAALENGRLAVVAPPEVRMREEDTQYLYHHAGGVISVPVGEWTTLASITVQTGKKLRLKFAEGDFADITSISNTRAIRLRKAGVVMAPALTGADQPNPDIEGIVLANTSGANETWDLQGRHNAITAQSMAGWFSWIEVSD